MPPKIRPSPQLSSDVIIEKKTTKATAPRGVFGTLASFLISLCTGGDVATTKPPMIIIAICIVNGISPQNPSPKYLTKFRVPTPASNPATKTIINPTSANTNASGNHFWDQSASPIPNRAKTPAESSPASCAAFRCGIDSMRPFRTGQISSSPARAQSPHLRIRIGSCSAGVSPAFLRGVMIRETADETPALQDNRAPWFVNRIARRPSEFLEK